MKKYFYLFSLISVLPNTQLRSQTENKENKDADKQYKVVITANSGSSLVGKLLAILPNGIEQAGLPEFGYKYTQTPALQLAGDYYASKVVSIGAAVCYQQFNGQFTNYSYKIDGTNTIITESFSAKLTRTQIGARVLFHFYNEKRMDLFSGLRVGPTIWGATATATDPNFKATNIISGNGAGFAFQLVYFGMRGYITDNFGLNFELAIGSPYYASGGLNYRF